MRFISCRRRCFSRCFRSDNDDNNNDDDVNNGVDGGRIIFFDLLDVIDVVNVLVVDVVVPLVLGIVLYNDDSGNDDDDDDNEYDCDNDEKTLVETIDPR